MAEADLDLDASTAPRLPYRMGQVALIGVDPEADRLMVATGSTGAVLMGAIMTIGVATRE